MPVFYRAGSIIPILLHENALSLLRAINNNIALEVYTTTYGVAEGNLVLDDGWSTKTEESIYKFAMTESGFLSVYGYLVQDYISGKKVTEVTIYGMK